MIEQVLDTAQGVTLMGEAAQSWVRLQWFKEFVFTGFVFLLIYSVYRFMVFVAKHESEDNK